MPDVAQVRPYLFFGSASRSREDIERLMRQGITAVLCLETDDDLTEYGLRWTQLEDWYQERAMAARRVPILDFSPDAIVAHLDDALGSLAGLLRDGHIVYVHCSEGISRSPTIVIAHLVRAEGLSFGGALRVVRTARPSINPYTEVLELIAASSQQR